MFYKIMIDETKVVSVALGTDTEYYKKNGFVEGDVEQAYDGQWYLKGFAPVEPLEHKNDIIHAARQDRFVTEADPLKLDYDEAVARYGEDDGRTVSAKEKWLAKKDEIREALSYIDTVMSGAVAVLAEQRNA